MIVFIEIHDKTLYLIWPRVKLIYLYGFFLRVILYQMCFLYSSWRYKLGWATEADFGFFKVSDVQ